MKCCSSGIHTLRRRICQRGQAQGHRSATNLPADRTLPCGVRRVKRVRHVTPACRSVRERGPCAELLLKQRTFRATGQAAAECAPVPPLVRLHVAPLVLAVLGALVARRLGLRTRRARVARRHTGLAGACSLQAVRGAAPAASNASPLTAQRRSAPPPRAQAVRRYAAADAPRCAARPATGSCPRRACCPRRRAGPQAPLPLRAAPPWAHSCPSRS